MKKLYIVLILLLLSSSVFALECPREGVDNRIVLSADKNAIDLRGGETTTVMLDIKANIEVPALAYIYVLVENNSNDVNGFYVQSTDARIRDFNLLLYPNQTTQVPINISIAQNINPEDYNITFCADTQVERYVQTVTQIEYRGGGTRLVDKNVYIDKNIYLDNNIYIPTIQYRDKNVYITTIEYQDRNIIVDNVIYQDTPSPALIILAVIGGIVVGGIIAFIVIRYLL